MAETPAGDSLNDDQKCKRTDDQNGKKTDDQKCKRFDGKNWRCGRPVVKGKSLCELHIQQSSLRHKKQPVPDHLKLERAKRGQDSAELGEKKTPEQSGDDSEATRKRDNKEKTEGSGSGSGSGDGSRKRAKKEKNEYSAVIVRKLKLKLGTMTIAAGDGSSSSQNVPGSPVGKVGDTGDTVTEIVNRRPIRSKNSEPVPVPVVKVLPSISENIKASKDKAAKDEKANDKEAKDEKANVLPSISENIKASKDKALKDEKASISENVKASKDKAAKDEKANKKAVKTKEVTVGSKKKSIKKCHWCGLRSFCVLVKCLTCNKTFFCQECINKRLYCEKTVKRECPVCQGECSCRACARGKPKQDKTKEPIIHDIDEGQIISDPETEITVAKRDMMSDFEIIQQLHMIRELLPVMAKLNQEKNIELDTEARNKGLSHDELEVQISGYTLKKECSFCKACIPDFHRSCNLCSFLLCLACCHDFHDGCLHSSIENMKETRMIRSKSLENTTWRLDLDGRISCPPKSLGGCKRGFLQLTSFYPYSLTKDLEESGKQILCSFQYNILNGLSDSSSSSCFSDENGEAGLYFATKPELKDDNLERFMKQWGKGQPIVIRDVFKGDPNLDWDLGFILCEYLVKSAEARNNTESRSAKSTRDWCTIDITRSQTFSSGITYENVWIESLKFKLRFSLEFFQDHFPEHCVAVIQSLPIQEYMNPYTGFLNLGAYSPYQTKNPYLGSYVSILYGGLDSPKDSISNLCFHAYDVVNILVHATNRPISETKLNKAKTLMNDYNSHDHLKSSKKIARLNKLEEMFASSSRLDDTHQSDVDMTSSRPEETSVHDVVVVSESESESESDDEEVDICGVYWDIFRREDVPMLLEYLRKCSKKISKSKSSCTEVVHPLFDDVFYLNDDQKTRLKEEYNVCALSFEQNIGEAVIIPAGCPYQMKRIKSCVNVVYEFVSPESALESIKVSDEIRLLPVNHKAKGNVVEVKEMAINRMQAAVEEMRKVFASQPKWSWAFVISDLTKPPTS